jgi:SPP1 family holin
MNTNMTNDIVRVVIFVLSWVNSFLVAHGHKPIPFIDETQVAWVITFVVSIWAMCKEAPFKKFFTKTSGISEAGVIERPSELPNVTLPTADASGNVTAKVATPEATKTEPKNDQTPN